jgi:hypothetical protein
VGAPLGEKVTSGIEDGVELGGGEGDAPFEVPITPKGASEEPVVT